LGAIIIIQIIMHKVKFFYSRQTIISALHPEWLPHRLILQLYYLYLIIYSEKKTSYNVEYKLIHFYKLIKQK